MATVNVKNTNASIFQTERLGIVTTNIRYGQDWDSVSQSYTGYKIVGNDFGGVVVAALSDTITDIEAVTSDDEYFAKDSNPDPILPRHTIYLGPGNDYLQGGRTPEVLYGGGDDDVVLGRGGDDRLRGGLGDDSVTGGDGDDIFVLAQGEGGDSITDFEAGVDLIGLARGLTFRDLTFDGSEIKLGEEKLATFEGVDTATLDEFDFVIV